MCLIVNGWSESEGHRPGNPGRGVFTTLIKREMFFSLNRIQLDLISGNNDSNSVIDDDDQMFGPLLRRSGMPAGPLETFMDAVPDIASPDCSFPFFRMNSTTSVSLCVPKSVSSCCFEGWRRIPCVPCSERKIRKAIRFFASGEDLEFYFDIY